MRPNTQEGPQYGSARRQDRGPPSRQDGTGQAGDRRVSRLPLLAVALLSGCALAPTTQQLAAPSTVPAAAALAQAEDCDSTAAQLLGWGLGAVAAGIAGVPTGTAISGLDPWERASVIVPSAGSLAVGGVLVGLAYATDRTCAAWRLLGAMSAAGPGVAPDPWAALNIRPEPLCTDPECP